MPSSQPASAAFALGEEVADGAFRRQVSAFRDHVSADPSAAFPAEAGRYHLYVARACPWSHRTILVRALKGLENAISMACAHPFRDARGWAFPGGPHTDPVLGLRFLAEAYERTEAAFEGRVTVPALWDRRTERIVSNESTDLVRMLGSAFDAVARRPELDLYPEGLREEIDAVAERAYTGLQNGVYRAGFARSQGAYDEAVEGVIETMTWLEELLGTRRYLAGDVLTEADWRLFPTLVRFDEVYHTHFRCNHRRLLDHPRLWAYARELFQRPGVAATVAMDEIKTHYYTTHDDLNPKHILPVGPRADWWAPHGRGGAVEPVPAALRDEQFAYLTTTGRRSGHPREIEIWFAAGEATIYLISGGRDRSNWVRNLVADPRATLRIGAETFATRARPDLDRPEERARAAALLHAKYGGQTRSSEEDWRRGAYLVALDLEAR